MTRLVPSFLLLLADPAQAPAPPASGFVELFLATGFVGPLMALAGLVAVALAVRRWLELRPARLAPLELQRSLETAVHDGRLETGLEQAAKSRTLLGELVAAGLHLRRAGLDEMLANVERATAKEALRLGNRVASLGRLGGLAVLAGLFGTTESLISMLLVIQRLKAPLVGDFARGIGEALPCTALGLLVALFSFGAFFALDAKLTRNTLAVREIAEELMRDAAEKGRA
jgi:biopolymer transport protein ExbB